MTPIQLILKALPGNTETFIKLCESKVVSDDLETVLEKGIDQGRLLLRDIERVALHLTTLKEKLKTS